MSTTFHARTLVPSIVDVENTQGLVCLSATDGNHRTTYMLRPENVAAQAAELAEQWGIDSTVEAREDVLRARVVADTFHGRGMERRSEIAAGTRVRVIDGPNKGRVGTVVASEPENYGGRDYTAVLLDDHDRPSLWGPNTLEAE